MHLKEEGGGGKEGEVTPPVFNLSLKIKNVFLGGNSFLGIISLLRVGISSPNIVMNLPYTFRSFTENENHIGLAVQTEKKLTTLHNRIETNHLDILKH